MKCHTCEFFFKKVLFKVPEVFTEMCAPKLLQGKLKLFWGNAGYSPPRMIGFLEFRSGHF